MPIAKPDSTIHENLEKGVQQLYKLNELIK